MGDQNPYQLMGKHIMGVKCVDKNYKPHVSNQLLIEM